MAVNRPERGYTMLELGVVLAVVGVLLVTAMYFHDPGKGRTIESAAEYQDKIVESIYSFAARNFRLPCADTDGDGYEGGAAGCAATDVVGGVPYKTLGLVIPGALGSGFEKQFMYGVYRNAALDADLASLVERTGDAAGDSEYLQLNDLRKALRNANASLGALDAALIHVTGDGSSKTGAISCAGNKVVNVAFFVVNGGTRDADADGSLFDGENAPMTWPGVGKICVSGPHTPATAQYDDAVRAVGFSELLGHLTPAGGV